MYNNFSKNGNLDASDLSNHNRLKELLEIDDTASVDTIKQLIKNPYKQEVQAVVVTIMDKDNTQSIATVYGKLMLKQRELQYPNDEAKFMLSEEVTAVATDILKKASKYLCVQNLGGCYKNLDALLMYIASVIDLIQVSNEDLQHDDKVLADLKQVWRGGKEEE